MFKRGGPDVSFKRMITVALPFFKNCLFLFFKQSFLEPFKKCFQIAPQRKQNICIIFIQRRPDVFDIEPTLYNIYAKDCVCWHSFNAIGLLSEGILSFSVAYVMKTQ